MKKTNKLLLTLLLVLLTAALVAVGLSAAAEDPTVVASGYCGGEGDGTNLTWTLDSEGLLTISGKWQIIILFFSIIHRGLTERTM